MAGLKIFTSNRLEILAQQLADIVRAPILSPLEPEVIIVQSKGMERWISMELARHNGISANCRFPFPNAFLEYIIRRMIPNLPEDSLFEPGTLTFRIMKLLPGLLNKPDFEHLNTYLRDDTNKLKLYQLSGKIADIFDQYLVFRPEMIFGWEAGNPEKLYQARWQAHLWRELTRGNEQQHRARLRQILFDGIANRKASASDFPQRISVFGISYLPPFHLQTFAAISRLIEVNLFILNPCQEYWFDIVSDREIRKQKKFSPIKDITSEDLHLESGNRLLASMGALGRDFLSLLAEFDSEVHEQFEDQACCNTLSCIQSDILFLRDKAKTRHQGLGSHSAKKLTQEDHKNRARNRQETSPLLESEGSIQIHSCHSPLREMEILHDNLLAMFEEDSELSPNDIIVMTPDIESYAPYVHIVFDTPKADPSRIPYSIADQIARDESRLIAGFLSMLDLKTSRFGSLEILNILNLPGVREKFGMTEYDIQKIEHWVQDANIRWGINADSRRKLGLPGFSENTWEAGIRRFLIGYAMPGNDKDLFKGILPYDAIEGAEFQVLGKFIEFWNRILWCRNNLQKPRPLSKWHATLLSVLDQLFLPDEEKEPEFQFLRGTLDDLTQKQNRSGYNDAIDLEVVREHLEVFFAKRSFGHGFLKGGVTFCAMLPMRSIPFKVICLVGMNSDTFPRDARTLSFDLIAKHPRKGDRSRRNDDKYLFLEAIISARKKLYISYVGQRIQDNAKMPPSALVNELLDVLLEEYGLTEDQLITRHRLQPFNPVYFQQGSNLFSYSLENFRVAAHLFDQKDTRPFISKALPPPPEEWKSLTIDQLGAFYANPAKYLLQQRFGIFFDDRATVSEEREPFNLDNLQKYSIGQDLLQKRLDGFDVEEDLSVQAAKGALPHGRVGQYFFKELSNETDAFIRKTEKFMKVAPFEDIWIDLDISGFHLSGKITGMHHYGLVRSRFANKKTKHLISSWIHHFILCAGEDFPAPLKTTLICKDSVLEFEPLKDSREILQSLVQIYWQGLSKPLPFFPESSYVYAYQRITKKKSPQIAVNSALVKWSGNEFQRGEIEDPYFKLCFKNMNPLGHDFETLALKIFTVVFRHCREFDVTGI